MKVYQFYNGEELKQLPAEDRWSNFKNQDTIKLAWFAAESWRRQGWEVERITTKDVFGFAHFEGFLKEHEIHYPLKYWDLWFVLRRLAPCWFTTIDVMNYGFSGNTATGIETYCRDSIAANLMTDHISAAAMYVTPGFCDNVIQLICEYDLRGPRLATVMVSDETLIREYLKNSVLHFNFMKFAIIHDGPPAPLIHFPKSVLQHYKAFNPAVNA